MRLAYRPNLYRANWKDNPRCSYLFQKTLCLLLVDIQLPILWFIFRNAAYQVYDNVSVYVTCVTEAVSECVVECFSPR